MLIGLFSVALTPQPATSFTIVETIFCGSLISWTDLEFLLVLAINCWTLALSSVFTANWFFYWLECNRLLNTATHVVDALFY